MRAAAAIALAIFAASGGCATVQSAAAKDPMRCERDPNCNSKYEKSRDCYTVCSDDLACVDRCRQVTRPSE